MKNEVSPTPTPSRLPRTDAEHCQIGIPAMRVANGFVNGRGGFTKLDGLQIYKIYAKYSRVLHEFIRPRRPTVSHHYHLLLRLSILEDSRFPFQITRNTKS